MLDFLQTYSAAVQAASGAISVVVTVVLVVVTIVYVKAAQKQATHAHNQVDELKKQRYDLQRPVVLPIGELQLPDKFHLDLAATKYDIKLQNVGPGVALIVCGVLFPPAPTEPPRILPTRYTLWRDAPLMPGDEPRPATLEIGKTLMDGAATLEGYQLYAPEKPTRWGLSMEGKYNVVARLSLTYEDSLGQKHAGIYDYVDLYGWQRVALIGNIEKDLEQIDNEARAVAVENSRPHFVPMLPGHRLPSLNRLAAILNRRPRQA